MVGWMGGCMMGRQMGDCMMGGWMVECINGWTHKWMDVHI